MGFKMKGFNAGKGTGASKGFPYVGEYVPQSDGSVVWRPSKEERIKRRQEENENWKPPKKDKTKWEEKTEKAIAKYENAKRKNEKVPRSVLKYLHEADPDWLSKQNYHTFSNLSDSTYNIGLDFDDHVRTDIFGNRMYDRKGGAKGNKTYKRYMKAREKGLSHEQALQKIGYDWDPSTMDSTKNRKFFREQENQWEDDPNIIVDSNYKDPNNPKLYITPKEQTEEEKEAKRIEKETDATITDDGNFVGEKIQIGENPKIVKKLVDENVSIGSGDKENDVSVDVAEKTFDPADTNQDGDVDKWEEKAAKRAAMFAKKNNPHKFDSPEWWDWKNASNVAKSNTKKSAFTVLNKYGKKWI